MMQRRKHFKILSLKGRLRVSSMVAVGGNPGEWHSWMERVTSLEEQRVCEWGGGTDRSHTGKGTFYCDSVSKV